MKKNVLFLVLVLGVFTSAIAQQIPLATLTVAHATVQNFPAITTPVSQEFYRFSTVSDSAYQIGTLTFYIEVAGMEFVPANSVFSVKKVNPDGTINVAADIATCTPTFSENNAATVTVNFTNEKASAGETRTYALFVSNTVEDAVGVNDDQAVSISILGDSVSVGPMPRADIINSNIVWSDLSDSLHCDISPDWWNGYFVSIPNSPQINTGSALTTETIEPNPKIQIFPNPTTGILNFKNVPNGTEIQIFNILGSEIEMPRWKQIDLTNQPNGTYFIKVDGTTRKIVKR